MQERVIRPSWEALPSKDISEALKLFWKCDFKRQHRCEILAELSWCPEAVMNLCAVSGDKPLPLRTLPTERSVTRKLHPVSAKVIALFCWLLFEENHSQQQQ